jgi:MFS transporter, DHA1 family, inner membrane transport protein
MRLRVQLIIFTLARLVINTGHRMAYPFLPEFARGLHVSENRVALAIAARSSLGLISPIFGSLADVRGRKFAVLTGLMLFTGSMFLVVLWPTITALFIGLMLAGTGKLIYDAALQSYIGDRVHYARRGQAIAVTELSWSGAFLLGMPLIGWLIERFDIWQAPFTLLACLGTLAVLLVWRAVPSDAVRTHEFPSLKQGLRIVLTHRPALAGLSVSFLISACNETVMIIYGPWMERTLKFSVVALGASAIVIGIAELIGETGVAGFVDRLGKRRAIALGIALNAAAAPLLPLLGVNKTGALIALFLFFITFEFALVSSLPLMTELLPNARATLMAGNAAAFAGGRTLGGIIGPQLFVVGLGLNVAVGAVFDLLALAVLLFFVHQD